MSTTIYFIRMLRDQTWQNRRI